MPVLFAEQLKVVVRSANKTDAAEKLPCLPDQAHRSRPLPESFLFRPRAHPSSVLFAEQLKVVVRSEAVSLLQTRAWAVEFHGEIFALSDIDVA